MTITCNTTLENERIMGETAIAGPFTFHTLAEIIGGACTGFAILCSLYLMAMHAFHYTKPTEQKYILRILFMVPVYAVSSWLQIRFYWHAIYFSTITDCYEAFAIASFFALLCQYVAPDLHMQKNFFRELTPIQAWVWPINWFKACCCGQRGPWRTPTSGLTWFNIIWVSVYQYCFIRVAMTITAVVLQYFDRYCQSSDNPVFGHIWVLVINSIAVTIAMYGIIQFYVQLRKKLVAHSPLLKVLSIKLVIFLSFWQTAAISFGTTENVVAPNNVLAYPDIAVGIPALLLCFEMFLFSILHQFAYPWKPYRKGAPAIFYPLPDDESTKAPLENTHGPNQGGFMGFRAFWDSMNLWDVVKAFGRGMRWLFVGVHKRKDDVSYHTNTGLSGYDRNKEGTDTSYPMQPYGKSTDHLPIASEFRRSKFGTTGLLDNQGPQRGNGGMSAIRQQYLAQPAPGSAPSPTAQTHEGAALMQNAQMSPRGRPAPRAQTYRGDERDAYGRQVQQQWHQSAARYQLHPQDGGADSGYYDDGHSRGSSRGESYHGAPGAPENDAVHSNPAGRNPRDSTQLKVGQALWGNWPGQAM